MSLSIPKKISLAQIKEGLRRVPFRIWYGLLVFAMIPSYFIGREIMIDQSTSYVAVLSQFTVNFVIFLYLAGVWIDSIVRKKGYTSKVGWLIWAVVMVAIVLFFKYVGGMETRF